MRNVYCKTESIEESKKCARALYNRFYKLGYNPQYIGENKIELSCKGYDIKFLEDKQWLTFTTTKAGTGYMTIPYNRILISPYGVKQEECKLGRLLELVREGF